MIMRILMAVALCGLSACTSGRIERLRTEIGVIEQRVTVIEARIDSDTSPIRQASEGMRAHIGYVPLTRWATSFNARPDNERTIRFQQTGHTGYILRKSHHCRPLGHSNAGQEAQFSNSNVTRGAILVRSLTAAPQADGLILSAPLQANFSTTVSASYRPPCLNWNRFPPVGINGEARPLAAFQLRLAMLEGGTLGYSIDMVSPPAVNLELSTDVGPFTVRFTVPIRHLAARLAQGEMSLLLDRMGNVTLPDGQVVGYRVGTINPHVQTSLGGIELASDIVIEIDHPALSAAFGSQAVSQHPR